MTEHPRAPAPRDSFATKEASATFASAERKRAWPERVEQRAEGKRPRPERMEQRVEGKRAWPERVEQRVERAERASGVDTSCGASTGALRARLKQELCDLILGNVHCPRAHRPRRRHHHAVAWVPQHIVRLVFGRLESRPRTSHQCRRGGGADAAVAAAVLRQRR